MPRLRRRADPPLPGLRGAVLLDVRGRLRGLRRAAARARALRDPDPPRRPARASRLAARLPELRLRLDRREADHRDGVVLGDLAVVELARGSAPSRSARRTSGLSCSISRGESSREALHLDLVDHRVEDVLARPEAGADEHRDDHSLLVLARLVAEPDRRRLAVGAELRLDDRRVEVERERGTGPRSYVCSRGERRPRLLGHLALAARRRAARAPRRAAASAPRRPRGGTPPGSRPSRPPLVADEEERDDLEDPLALPVEPVPDVAELPERPAVDARLLGDLAQRRRLAGLARVDPPLRQHPEPVRLARPAGWPRPSSGRRVAGRARRRPRTHAARPEV